MTLCYNIVVYEDRMIALICSGRKVQTTEDGGLAVTRDFDYIEAGDPSTKGGGYDSGINRMRESQRRAFG